MDTASQDPLSFECPACNASLTVPGYLAGIAGPCPRCGGQITAPNPVAQAATVQQGIPVPNGAASVPPSPAQAPAPIPGFPDAPPPVAPANPNAAAAALGIPPQAETTPPAPAANSALPWTPLDQAQSPAAAPATAPRTAPVPETPAAAADAVAAPRPQAPAEPEPVFAGVPIPSPSASAEQVRHGNQQKQRRPLNKRAIVFVLLTVAILGSAFAGYKFLMAKKSGNGGAQLTPPPVLPAPRPDPPLKPAPTPAVAGTPSNPLHSNTPPLPAAATATTPPRPTPPDPGEDRVTGGGNDAPLPAGTPVEAGADAARKTLDSFLAAASVEQRAEHVQAHDQVMAEMQAYYKKHPLEVDVTSVEFKLSGQVPGSARQFHVFQVTTGNQAEGFPVSVEETSRGPRVDWVAFTQFHDNALGKFVRIYQHQPATFHAIVERAHYFRTDVPDVGSKVCVRVRPPIPGYEGYAFIDSDSPLAQTAAEKFEWDHMYFPVVELKWVRGPEGHQYIELTKIVQDNWRATK